MKVQNYLSQSAARGLVVIPLTLCLTGCNEKIATILDSIKKDSSRGELNDGAKPSSNPLPSSEVISSESTTSVSIGKSATNPLPIVTSVEISNDGIVITGSHLDSITTLRISSAESNKEKATFAPWQLNIQSKTQTKIVTRSESPLKLIAGGLYNLLIATADAETIVPITFNLSNGIIPLPWLATERALAGQILAMNESETAWEPRSLEELSNKEEKVSLEKILAQDSFWLIQNKVYQPSGNQTGYQITTGKITFYKDDMSHKNTIRLIAGHFAAAGLGAPNESSGCAIPVHPVQYEIYENKILHIFWRAIARPVTPKVPLLFQDAVITVYVLEKDRKLLMVGGGGCGQTHPRVSILTRVD